MTSERLFFDLAAAAGVVTKTAKPHTKPVPEIRKSDFIRSPARSGCGGAGSTLFYSARDETPCYHSPAVDMRGRQTTDVARGAGKIPAVCRGVSVTRTTWAGVIRQAYERVELVLRQRLMTHITSNATLGLGFGNSARKRRCNSSVAYQGRQPCLSAWAHMRLDAHSPSTCASPGAMSP